MIKSLDSKSRSQWPELLSYLVFIYNSTPHSVTGFTPYTLMFGRQPTVPLDQLLHNTRGNWAEDTIANQAKLIQETHQIARDRLTKAAAKNKRHYDKHADARPLPIGSRVLLKHCAFTERHKLSDQYDPQQFVVIKRNKNGDLYAIRPSRGGKERWVNRKMLILDPRGETVDYDYEEPSFGLPLVPESSSDSEESDESPDWDWVIQPLPEQSASRSEPTTPNTQPPSASDLVPKRPDKHVSEKHADEGALRRSERIRKRLAGWPNAIT